ncbi:MAG: phosphoribosylformylglycinamidine synthase I [Syntrophales bacterium]|nr:phosphoribosylformylglycinamidine synthase I [Syntrophales bacterium]MDD5643332.1 phosphoribosylformylglycinamidine synthase I [Syntrophales bacterium]
MKTENRKPKTENPAPKPKALVLYGYGLNCDHETAFALNKAGAEAIRVHTTDLLENPALLWDYHLLAVPGGFSWGDDHGAGVILALRLKLALGAALQDFIDSGRLVIGICNGFQVLVNLGILPNLAGRPGERLTALIPNDCGNFRDAWVHLKAIPSKCVFTQGLDLLELPIRHGEGKFYAEGPVLAELADRGQIVLKYATPSGNAALGRFPYNPNGSLMDIAGICDATGRVLGLMPHPEAHIVATQHPAWTARKEQWRRRGEPYPEQEGAGISFFYNAVNYLQKNLAVKTG